MPHDQFLGNDLVHWDGADAREKQPDSARAQRFLQRVLHPQEQKLFHRLTSPNTPIIADPLPWHKALWSLWAAKEAVFKAAVKAAPGLAFSPRSIRILMDPRVAADTAEPEACSPLGWAQAGWAEIGELRYRISWESCSAWVHALAIGPVESLGSVDSIGQPTVQQHRVQPDEASLFSRIIRGVDQHDRLLGSGVSARSGWQVLRGEAERSSAAVRRLAVNLVRHLPGVGHDPAEIIEVRRPKLPGGISGPPMLHSINEHVNSRLRSLDISLSHDGPWSAAAILV